MAGYSLLLASLALCIVHHAICQAPSVLTITPNSLTLSPTQADTTGARVTVVCKPPSNAGRVYVMMINRNVGNTKTPLVTTDPINPDDEQDARLLQTLDGFSVSGSVKEKSITLVMAEAKCHDAAEYVCVVDAAGVGATLNHVKALNLTVKVDPNNITLTGSPSKNTWKVNETLTIDCNGIVGSVMDETKIEWVWEYQQKSEFGDFSSQGWRPYSESDFYNLTDIKTGSLNPGSSVPNSCYKRQTSQLNRRLQEEDTRREYRCYVKSDGRSFESFAKVLAVGTVSLTDSGTGGNTGGSGSPSKANVGAIVGGIIGALIVIIVVIILVYFLVIRRRKNKDSPETYDESANDNKPVDPIGPPGYTSHPDPSVTYSAPNRFRGDKDKQAPRIGQTNKAMDEGSPKTKDKTDAPRLYEPKPARYENDFHQRGGRRNPSYDYDNRGRNYSSDDGGSNMNTSMHSMGDGDPTIGTAI